MLMRILNGSAGHRRKHICWNPKLCCCWWHRRAEFRWANTWRKPNLLSASMSGVYGAEGRSFLYIMVHDRAIGLVGARLLQCEGGYFAFLAGCRCMAGWQGGFITWGSSLDSLHNHWEPGVEWKPQSLMGGQNREQALLKQVIKIPMKRVRRDQ